MLILLHMDKLIQVLAKLEVFEGENMRRISISSGYRPAFKFESARTMLSGQIELLHEDYLRPGCSTILKISFVKGIIDDSFFTQEEPFTFSEGTNPLGRGQIIERL